MKLQGTLLFILVLCLGAHATPYTTLAEQCDGFPKLAVGTADNFCLGLLIQKSPTINFKMHGSRITRWQIAGSRHGRMEPKARQIVVDRLSAKDADWQHFIE